MPFEIRSEADLVILEDAAASFAHGSDSTERLIQRVEDILPVESYAVTQVEWIVEGIIPHGSVTVISGDSGAGKSTFVTAMAYAISRGVRFLGLSTAKRPVLILDAENPIVAVSERLARLKVQTGDNFRIWGQWAEDDPPAAGSAVVQEWIARCDPRPVIVADSLIAFHPGSENDASETRRYMDRNYRALTKLGASVIIIHHLGRDTTKDFRGSSDVKGSIDVGYKLINLGDGARLSALELRAFKQRFAVTPRLLLQYRDGVFIADQREATKTVQDRLVGLLKEHPAVIGDEFERLAVQQGLGRNRARTFLKEGRRSGTIRVTPGGGNNRQAHTWTGGTEPQRVIRDQR